MTALACLALLAPASLPAQAQGNWTVTDQSGDLLSSSADGYKMKGSPTGSVALGGAYPDVLAAAQNPNASTTSDAFTPNLSSYQGWLFSGNAPGPYQVYDPFRIWTEAAAANTVGYRWSSGRAFRLGPPSNKDVNGSITAATGGTLWAIWQWSDPYASYPGYYTSHGQTPPQPPDHITVLLTSRVSASAAVGTYGSPPSISGLSATATASDSLNETVTATAGSPPPPAVTGKRLLRVPVDANGRAEVSLGGTTTATATNTVPYGTIGNYPGTSYGGYPIVTNGSTGANASASISGTAKADPRDVIIVCPTIEASYYKGPVDAQHTSGRWLHQRSPNGAMETDSWVTRSAGQYAVSTNSYGDSFNAQTSAFPHPYYTWKVPAPGGAIGNYSQQYLGVESDQYVSLPLQILFGPDIANLPKSTTITLKVRDSTDGATAENLYVVHWHLPVENWVLINRVPTTNRLYPNSGAGPNGETSIEPNTTIYYTIPVPQTDLSGPDVKAISVFLAGASAIAPALLPEAIATGPVGIVTVGLLAIGSTTAGYLVPPDPLHDIGRTSYIEFIKAAQMQQAINNGGSGMTRFNDNPSVVNTVLAEINRLKDKYGDPAYLDHWNEDLYFSQRSGHARATAQAGRYRQIETYKGDAYDQHGYKGPAVDAKTIDLDKFYVQTWTVTP